jgi:hypothetical protein
MNFFKSCLNLTLIGLLTCAGLATPVLATPDFDNSLSAADDEGNVDNGQSRTIKGDVTTTDDAQDFRQFTLVRNSTVRFSGTSNGGATDLLLVRDFNNNRVLDPGEIIAKSSGSFSHSFTRNLASGKYVVVIRSRKFSADIVPFNVTVKA